jgi:uncharacterized protein (TIGR03118 family)
MFDRSRRALSRQARPSPTVRFRPVLEALEDRRLMAGTVLQTNLVSDLPNVAAITDPNLVNPWGIAESSGSPFWISDNNAGVSTLYAVPGANNTPVSMVGLGPTHDLPAIIPAPGDPFDPNGTPTGTVFNIGPAGSFLVSGFTNPKTGSPAPTSASAVFLFATEDGTIVGWNPTVNPKNFDPAKAGTYGIIAVDNSTNPTAADGAVYKGLAIASGTKTTANPNGLIFASDANSGTVLYAANFRSGQIEVYDSNFQRVTTQLPPGAFQDPNLPDGYAPFNVQVLTVGGVQKVFVTYAKQDADKHDDVAGPHHGFVDVFNLDGTPGLPNMQERLVSRGALDSPWGLAIAPSSFGAFAGDLLVGNFGNGRIHVYNPTTGAFLGELTDPDGEPIQIDGLWALKVGNDKAGGASDTVYFTAGPFHESHGLFGSLSAATSTTPEGNAEAEMVTAALDVFQMDLAQVQKDLASGVSRATLRQDLKALQTAFVDLMHAEVRFAFDARQDAGVPTHGHDTDALDDLFAHLGHDRD